MPLYDITIRETAVYTTVVEAKRPAEARRIAEKKFLASIKVATMFCTEVPDRIVDAKLHKPKRR